MPHIEINDINFYYEIHGSGDPIILLMGLGSNITSYKSIIDNLAKEYKVIALDNRGSGRSDMPDLPYSMDMMANDTLGLMDKLNIKKANILGTSMGGRIALALVLSAPNRIKKIVLVSTFANNGNKVKSSITMKVFYLIKILPIFKSRYSQPHYAFLRQFKATIDFDVLSRLSEIKLPTLIMHGKIDKTVPFKHAVELNSGIKDSSLISFSGGHLFFVRGEKQKFLRLVNSWLST